jgi:methionyl-tRNA synthetase
VLCDQHEAATADSTLLSRFIELWDRSAFQFGPAHLVGYISALGFGDSGSSAYQEWWLQSDERIHVIGKGILRFHAVYWLAFLASAGQPAPTRIQVHPYLTVEGAKLSKSSKNAVDPVQIVSAYGTEALRWWFARDVGPVADTDFTTARLIARANEDLANGLGNLVSRIVTLVHRYRRGEVPAVETEIAAELGDLGNKVDSAVGDFDLRGAARLVCEAVAQLNRDLEDTQPWAIANRAGTPAQRRLDSLLARHVKSAREIARVVEPFVPALSTRLLEQLGMSTRLPTPVPAFTRIEGP